MATSSSRKSLAKAEDDKEDTANTDGGDGLDTGSEDRAESTRKDEMTQPLAADASTSVQDGQKS